MANSVALKNLLIALSIAGALLIAGFVTVADLPDHSRIPASFSGGEMSQSYSWNELGADQSSIEVEARGRKFKWTFRYPGRDRALNTADDVLLEQDLRLPTNIKVALSLESDDYVYSLSCPTLGLKEIAVPDLTYQLEFATGESIGIYPLVADPMCGWSAFHDKELGFVVIEPRIERVRDE
ncbi:MAG: hypothetical protein AB8B91_17370 [Rubripirellula sp.]